MNQSSEFSRREFIRKGSIVGAGLGSSLLGSYLNFNNLSGPTSYSTSSTTQKLLDLLELKYPIVQAPMGGVVSSQLVSAVAGTGAFGGLPLTWTGPEAAVKKIKMVQESGGSFYINFVLKEIPPCLTEALDAGVKTVQFSWGMPSREQVKEIRKAGAHLGIQVTSAGSAQAALDLGADYLVCQGLEAGGHVHATRSLEKALEEVLPIAKNVPVVASGGIANGTVMKKYMDLGAAGVVMGSRFLATQDSAAHQDYKKAIVKASSEDTVFTCNMNKGWDNATHRILRNSTHENWESAGCPFMGERPGEHDILGTTGSMKIVRYSPPCPNTSTKGDIEAMTQYAGMGIDHIHDLPKVGELVPRIWSEFLKA